MRPGYTVPTLGIVPGFDQRIASDGINEFLENLWRARAWRRDMGALRGEGERIAFTGTDTDTDTDTDEAWVVTRQHNGFNLSYRSERRARRADAKVRATVQDLYLLSWKRLSLDGPGVAQSGDEALLRRWYRYSSV